MSERIFTILSTASLPFEKMGEIPSGVAVLVDPFTVISARESDALRSRINGLSSQEITVVFTSAHAVKIVGAMLHEKPSWKIYCIRNETRVAVINWFGAESIVRFASNAFHLSQLMIGDGVRDAVFFCGDQRMDILPDNLTRHGVELIECTVYDTKLLPHRLSGQPQVILFFSPTAVRSFFSSNEMHPDTRVFVMGKTTGAAFALASDHPFITSPEADKVFVLNMALDFATSHKMHE